MSSISALPQSINGNIDTYDQKEAIAIKLVQETGVILAREFSKIADDYRGGMLGPEIVKKYDIASKFGLTFEISTSAVYYTIKILLTEKERKKILAMRRIEAGKKGGKAAVDKGAGIHSLPHEQKAKNAIEGGKAAVDKGAGVHSLSSEQLARNGIRGILAQGKTPWLAKVIEPNTQLNEKEYCIYLSSQQECLHSKGPNIGKPNAAKIAAKLNEIFHGGKGIRTRIAVNRLFQDHRSKSKNC